MPHNSFSLYCEKINIFFEAVELMRHAKKKGRIWRRLVENLRAVWFGFFFNDWIWESVRATVPLYLYVCLRIDILSGFMEIETRVFADEISMSVVLCRYLILSHKSADKVLVNDRNWRGLRDLMPFDRSDSSCLPLCSKWLW